jgi:hypothetical protein
MIWTIGRHRFSSLASKSGSLAIFAAIRRAVVANTDIKVTVEYD